MWVYLDLSVYLFSKALTGIIVLFEKRISLPRVNDLKLGNALSTSLFALPECSSDFWRVFAETVNFNVLH